MITTDAPEADMSLEKSLFLARRRLHNVVSRHRWLFFLVNRFRRPEMLVDRETDLVIEGFPRSANSFAEAAMRVSQVREIKLAHHTHASCQILRAAELSLPVLILFRDPDDAVASLLEMYDINVGSSFAYSEYVEFYEVVLRAREAFLLAHFTIVTSDFPRIINSLNERFKLNLANVEMTDEVAASIREEMDRNSQRYHAGRNERYSHAQSEAFKSERERRLRSIKSQLGEAGIWREKAHEIYRRLLDNTVLK